MKCKFRDKLDLVFWWLMWLLPLLAFLMCCAFRGDPLAFDAFETFIDGFNFAFIRDIFVQFNTVTDIHLPSVLLTYCSYLVAVEMIHVLVDVLVFIPRFCHNLVDSDNYTIGRGLKG